MKFIILVCSGIASTVLYVAISFAYDFIGIALRAVTDFIDHHLGDQIDVFDEALNGKRDRKESQ